MLRGTIRQIIGDMGFLLVPSLILIMLLWLPFGFEMGGLIEEWGVYALFDEVGPFVFGGPNGPMPDHQLRPLMVTPWALAYMVNPNSWWPCHIELMLALVIKGASMSWIAHYLVGSRKWSVAAGLLFVVWPADTMQMAFRGLPIVLSVGVTTLGAILFLMAWSSSSRVLQTLLALLGGTCLVVASWTYEASLLLAPLPLLLIYAKEGFSLACQRTTRGFPVSLVWLAAVSLSGIYILYVLLTANHTYQQSVVGDRAQVLASLYANAPKLFTHGFVRSLADCWLDALLIFAQDFSSHWYFLVVATIFIVILITVGRGDGTIRPAFRVRTIRIVAIGTIALALGYLPFLLSGFHLAISHGTFYFASVGAVLIFLAGLTAVERFSRILSVFAAILLMTLGTAQQLFQFREYNNIYENQRKVLQAIVEQIPDLPSGKEVVVLDGSNSLNHTWMQGITLSSTLGFLYGHPVDSKICLTPLDEWVSPNSAGYSGACVETDLAWVFKSAQPFRDPNAAPIALTPDVTVRKDAVVIVRINADGTAPDSPSVLENRIKLQTGQDIVAVRYRSMLASDTWPAVLRFLDEPAIRGSYRWDFGHRWSLQHPEQGSGWNEAAWTYSPFRQTSAAWISQPRASLIFPLKPSGGDYALRMNILGNDVPIENLAIEMNGTLVPVNWGSATSASASISGTLLKDGINILEFESPVSKRWHVSFKVDWIELEPI